MLAPLDQKRLDEIGSAATELELQIAARDAAIITNLLKGRDTHHEEEKVENDRIVLASLKTSLRAIREKQAGTAKLKDQRAD